MSEVDDCRARALPYIKPALTDGSGPAHDLGYEGSPVLRDLGNGLLILYLVDTGERFEYVQNRHLAEAGIDERTLYEAAIKNLLSLMTARTRMQPHGNIFWLFLDGNFEASLLLIDQLWEESLAPYAPNGFLIAVPARDILAFTDLASAEGREELRSLVARVYPDGDHLISPELYRREAGRWERFEGD
jgi:uncharacterized protein YtpQ (UPF0354 family)